MIAKVDGTTQKASAANGRGEFVPRVVTHVVGLIGEACLLGVSGRKQQRSTWAQYSCDFGEQFSVLPDMFDHLKTQHDVKVVVWVRDMLAVVDREVIQGCCARLCCFDRPLTDVNAMNLPALPLPKEVGNQTRTAAKIEHGTLPWYVAKQV